MKTRKKYSLSKRHSPILKPNFDLRFTQIQLLTEQCSFVDRQVLLYLELVLQFHQLLGGERSAWLSI